MFKFFQPKITELTPELLHETGDSTVTFIKQQVESVPFEKFKVTMQMAIETGYYYGYILGFTTQHSGRILNKYNVAWLDIDTVQWDKTIRYYVVEKLINKNEAELFSDRIQMYIAQGQKTYFRGLDEGRIDADAIKSGVIKSRLHDYLQGWVLNPRQDLY